MSDDDVLRLLRRAWWTGFTVGAAVGCFLLTAAAFADGVIQ